MRETLHADYGLPRYTVHCIPDGLCSCNRVLLVVYVTVVAREGLCGTSQISGHRSTIIPAVGSRQGQWLVDKVM